MWPAGCVDGGMEDEVAAWGYSQGSQDSHSQRGVFNQAPGCGWVWEVWSGSCGTPATDFSYGVSLVMGRDIW